MTTKAGVYYLLTSFVLSICSRGHTMYMSSGQPCAISPHPLVMEWSTLFKTTGQNVADLGDLAVQVANRRGQWDGQGRNCHLMKTISPTVTMSTVRVRRRTTNGRLHRQSGTCLSLL